MSQKLFLAVALTAVVFINAQPGPPTPPPANDIIIPYAQRVQQQLNALVSMSSAPAQVKEAIRQKYTDQLTSCLAAAQGTDIMGFVGCSSRVIEEANNELWSY